MPVLSDATRASIREAAGQYPPGRQKSAVMPALYLAQDDAGHLNPEVLREVAELLRLAPVHVAAVATFYTMFEKAPHGKHIIDVCTCVSCQLLGGYDILAHLERRLGIKPGETTPDGRFTLREQECLGSCASAPVLQVGYRFHEELTTVKVDALIDELLQEGADG
ncbi:MAG: NAD(P)H-dependent oxidoreductase subunit E [Fimbriimonadaceae bacterium]|nr:NAD(P)H-dependent oxidoreductase subunit E [Fimbriimonadaceae bacterium]